jgi:glycosyltransferase involved in cell wall biosynthesis
VTTFGFLSTYPPTQCGLATFTAALASQVARTGDSVRVVSLVDAYSPQAPAEVTYQWVRDRRDQTSAAAAALEEADVVFVQHEYGIFGGRDGEDVLDLVRRLEVPVVVTLHTVLLSPAPRQREILEELSARASAVVTMTKAARERLLRGYAIDASKVHVVPHGAAAGRPRPADDRVQPRPWRMLTWGLLGPGKGVEWGIEALAELPDVDLVYDVVGETHPKVLAARGEAYRESLVERARQLGVADRVRFDGRYLTTTHLRQVVSSADLVLLPYESRDQVTSGVLVEAVAAGRAVISTDFPHARELLGGGVGLLVPPRDPASIAAAARRVVTEPGLAQSLRRRASRVAPSLSWAAVGSAYQRLGVEAVNRHVLAS